MWDGRCVEGRGEGGEMCGGEGGRCVEGKVGGMW